MSAMSDLLTTPLNALHIELGARMVPFAGYSMPVQYPMGLMAEHHHTRTAAGLFDVSHMGQLKLVGPDAAAAFETLMPVDVVDLPVGKQRYGLLLNDEGGIIDDLMFFRMAQDELFVIVNGACKVGDIAHIQARIGQRCQVIPMPDQALLALQGPQAAAVLARLAPGVDKLVFMTGGHFDIAGAQCFVTRSGYTGEDGFEISVPATQAEALARTLLAQPEVKPIGLGARNSLRLEAGLCLYGNDIDTTTTPPEAGLNWAIQKVRRTGGARAGGFPGADKVLAQIDSPATLTRKRVALVALERVPVREHTELQNESGERIGEVTSGLLAPTADKPIALAYVMPAHAAPGTRVNAMVRGKAVPMEVAATPFVPTRYYRG
ncbi:glycine cleavage system T protein [Acidovorax sp. JS42]|uniref:glycine cleavage system aminomethyltransferase GcvT n=1 Tax=unclassified Diaphorobacter TaxID=2649760 RepID=UPI0000DCD016|nr:MULTISPECIES: glycine cleavage system aminomethyltransferase GcvT [unclassified Diaphorobacter]ABM42118.1 glycine cleavage system T protein [Acidovorax sp. JS42]POR07724.1 glycine cleavage system aminomethyltransferase T [Diaphorobacter sp. LR2014-1]QPN31251.1 glycine cleavage system aminomethyltransferase GcvT [Diaphorobacter sp. JS3051]